MLVIVIVSLATGGPSKEVIEKFEQVKNNKYNNYITPIN